MTGYFDQFDNFDPLTERVPYHPFSMLPGIVERARNLLVGRTSDDIEAAAQNAEMMINGVFDHEEAPRRDEVVASDIWALKSCLESWDLSDDIDFPNGKDYEYPAVLALWKVVDAIRNCDVECHQDQLNRLGYDVKADERTLKIMASQNLIEAMEAVCWAEQLKAMSEQAEKSEQLSEAKLKQKRSLQAMKAAGVSHKETYALRKEVIDYWRENIAPNLSNEAAARLLAKQFPLSHRTLVKYVSEAKKELQSASRA